MEGGAVRLQFLRVVGREVSVVEVMLPSSLTGKHLRAVAVPNAPGACHDCFILYRSFLFLDFRTSS